MRTADLSLQEREDLIGILKVRFNKNPGHHKGLEWASVLARLEAKPEKLWSLREMEKTGGEPDVVGLDVLSREFIFMDCSTETPKGRRSICFDQKALEERKEHKPADSAMGMAFGMGVEILSEEQYRELQRLGEFDLKTSSWIKTPDDVRNRGGALFADRCYGRVFVYHNGAESYYGVRGFRAVLRV